MRIGRNLALTLVCVLLGIILSWQFRSINDNEKVAALENKRVEDLKTDLLNEQKKREELEKRNRELVETNSKFESAKYDVDKFTETLTDELKKAKMVAGLVDVKGKGVVLTLNNRGFVYVSATNLLDLVNELRAAEVRAITINDERIVAMSEVREAGNYVMVNGRRLSPPFVVKAIGDQDKLFYSLKMVGGILEELQNKLNVTLERVDNVVIPKVRDDGTVIKYDLMTPKD